MRLPPLLLLRLALLLPLALMLAACGSDDREALVIYSPHGKELLSASEEAFEALHPDVDVQWIDLGGQDAYDRIRTESARPQASLWWGGARAAFDRAASEDLLEPYQPTWSDLVPGDTHDPQSRWYGTYLTPEVIAYNTDKLTAETAPRDWDTLLNPAWNDRVVIRSPLGSATMRTIFSALLLRQPTIEEGYAWLARLDENTKAYPANPTQLYLQLARGEADVTLWNLPDILLQRDESGYPFGFHIPASGTPVLVDGIALVKGGPNLDRAQQFYEFVTSDSALVEQARTYYRIPVREDIDRAQMPAWYQDLTITPMDLDWDRIGEEEASWMRFWDENIRGRGAEYLQTAEARR